MLPEKPGPRLPTTRRFTSTLFSTRLRYEISSRTILFYSNHSHYINHPWNVELEKRGISPGTPTSSASTLPITRFHADLSLKKKLIGTVERTIQSHQSDWHSIMQRAQVLFVAAAISAKKHEKPSKRFKWRSKHRRKRN